VKAREAFTDEALATIVKAYNAHGLYGAAEHLGVPRYRVSNAIKAARKRGWTIPARDNPPLADAEIRRRVEAYGRLGQAAGCAELGISTQTLHRTIAMARERGIPVPPCPKRAKKPKAPPSAAALERRRFRERERYHETKPAFTLPRFIDAQLAHRIIVAGLPLRSERLAS
jgi:predicted DNA-binding protein (UPF0251 family)